MEVFKRLEDLDWISGSLILGGAFVLIVILSVVIVRRLINRKALQAQHDVTGFVFTNLGVLFAVLLGFTVVNVQQRFDKIKETTQLEASYLADLYQGADIYSEQDKNLIKEKIRQYVHSVVHEEWPLMATKEPSLVTLSALRGIWNAYYQIELSNKKQEIWYAESIRKLNLLVDARLGRILGSQDSLGTEMWTFLILGAIILVLFTAFFGIENILSHFFLGSILAISIAFLLFLIHSLDTVFTGAVQVSPEAMERILKTLP